MERERWLQLYALAQALSRSWTHGHRFSTAWIVAVYFWAVLHDRPVSWACCRAHWPAEQAVGALPSQATMSRRLRSAPVQLLLQRMEDALAQANAREEHSAPPPAETVTIIDAKPLPIGGYSKDRDARWGRSCGGCARGYKFYALWGAAPLPVAWEIQAMNVSEKRVAAQLLARAPGRGWLLGDAQYDSNQLYDQAFAQGYRLLAPRRKRGGLGHHYQSPHRLAAIAELEGGGWRRFHQQRTQIERHFGHWTSFGGGLAGLPSWVRTLGRVRRWVQAKLLINAVRILGKELANA